LINPLALLLAKFTSCARIKSSGKSALKSCLLDRYTMKQYGAGLLNMVSVKNISKNILQTPGKNKMYKVLALSLTQALSKQLL
jgi:hypothetical protein